MFCPECGAKNQDNVKFCVSCGADLRSVTPSKANPSLSSFDKGGEKGDLNSFSMSTDIGSADTIYDRDAGKDSGLSSGTLLGNRYRLEQELGRGGMGVVYKAFDTKLERAVAIKLLPEALARNNTAIELMKKEAKVAIGLAHPNIVKLNNFEQDKDGAYLIMEYVEGRARYRIFSLKKASSL